MNFMASEILKNLIFVKNTDLIEVKLNTGGLLFIPDLAVEEVSHVFRAAFYS